MRWDTDTAQISDVVHKNKRWQTQGKAQENISQSAKVPCASAISETVNTAHQSNTQTLETNLAFAMTLRLGEPKVSEVAHKHER